MSAAGRFRFAILLLALFSSSSFSYGGIVNTKKFMDACSENPSDPFCLDYVSGVFDGSLQTTCMSSKGLKLKDFVLMATSGISELRSLTEGNENLGGDIPVSLNIIWAWEYKLFGLQGDDYREYKKCTHDIFHAVKEMDQLHQAGDIQ